MRAHPSYVWYGRFRILITASALLLAARHGRAGWSTNAWNGDADSGISNVYHYTCAVNFNGPTGTVNGVPFDRQLSAFRHGVGWEVGGVVAVTTNSDPSIIGDSLTLADGFIYDGRPRVVTLTGLTTGRDYETTFFGVAWETGTRAQSFTSGGETAVVNQDLFGNRQGIRISYTFSATAPTRTFTIQPEPGSGTFHLSALCNREIPDVLTPGSYSHRMSIRFSDYGGDPLLNVPVLVVLRDGENAFSGDWTQPGGTDLRFAAADGVSLLDHEIEEWDSTGESTLWVRVPRLEAGAQIYVYYGDPFGTETPPSQTNGVVWSSGYGAVWHLGRRDGFENLGDATTSGHDAVASGNSTSVTAVVSQGWSFDGGDYLVASCPTQLAGNVDFSASFWMNYSPTPQRSWVMDFGQRGVNAAAHFLINTNGGAQFGMWSGVQNKPDISAHAGRWVHVLTTYRPDAGIETYLDGVLADATIPAGVPAIDPAGGFRIGLRQGTESDFVGQLDEVRVSHVARTADWAGATWLNQASNSVFNTYGLGTVHDTNAPLLHVAGGVDNLTTTSVDLSAMVVSTGSAQTMLTLFWGPGSGGRTPSNWLHEADLGVVSSTGWSTTNVTGLTPGTPYAFGYRAENAFGSRWAAGSFTTLGPPRIANLPPVVGARLAELNGELTATNGSPTSAVICWGPVDGGTATSQWAHAIALGQVNSGPVSTLVTLPLYGARYFYRCYATNAHGGAWAPATASFIADAFPVTRDGWRTHPWTGDLASRVNPADAYTAAVNLAGLDATLNGVPFQAHSLPGTGFTVGGNVNLYNDHINAVAGNSALLARDFIYNGNPRTVTLTDLVPGTRYETSFFGVGFDADGRVLDFETAGDVARIDENMYGNQNGMMVTYAFEADDMGERSYAIRPVTTRTFHLYALANRTVPHPPEITNLPVSDVTVTSATLNVQLQGEAAVFDVYALWGTTDGGVPGNAWQHTNFVASVTNVPETSLAFMATGMAGDSDYHYTFMASNLATNMTATPSATCQTAGVPAVSNLPPADIVDNGATLRGLLYRGGAGDVTVYWGGADAGATADGWANTTRLGRVISGPFATPVAASAAASYAYRCYVTNAFGSGWADPATWLSTPAPTLMVEDARVREGNIGATTLDFRVVLSAASVSNASVAFATVAGSADAGPDFVSTNGVLSVPAGQTNAGIHVTVRGDLLTEWPSEHLSLALSDPVACLLPQGQALGTIEDDDFRITDWRHKLKITFSGPAGGFVLTNFPAAVLLGPHLDGFDYAQFESVHGSDLRLFNASESAMLDFEIEVWKTNGTSTVWVRIPFLASQTSVWACWGNPSATALPPCTTNGTVWSDAFAGVWHLDQTNAVEDLRDATANRNHAILDDDTDLAVGAVAGGQYFDGGSDSISIPDSASLSVTGSATFSAWVNPETFSGVGLSQNIVAKSGNASYRFRIQAGGQQLWLLLNDGAGLETVQVDYAVPTNAWSHLAAVADFQTREVRFYANGAHAGTRLIAAKTAIADSPGTLVLGNYLPANANEDLVGILDEVRISDMARSHEWLRTCWENQRPDGSANTYGRVLATRDGLLLILR
jgi:hypothetical protein